MLSAKDVEVKRKLINAARTIRKKYLALKLQRDENDKVLNKVFAPLTKPLQKIAENTSAPATTLTSIPQDRKSVKKLFTKSEPDIFTSTPSVTFQPLSRTQKSMEDYHSFSTIKKSKSTHEEADINTTAKVASQQSQQQSEQQQQQPSQSSGSNSEGGGDDDDDPIVAVNFENSIDEQAFRPFLQKYPLRTQSYIYAHLINSDELDRVYGLKYNPGVDKWTIGSATVKFLPNGDISIRDQAYKGTRGLYDLLFYSKPTTYRVSHLKL
ncbi:hypothetical protein ABEB36_015324 [Hypothenemus hampei]|uniref:DUF8207 domain-containing protein n=1 Tax=Hypothenemus hampei TaxID=57062 RepID=A0ABD1DZV8_HYPHA